MNNNKLYVFLLLTSLFLLFWYTYNSMLFLGFEEKGASSFSAITKMTIVIMSVYVMLSSGNKRQSSFSMLWLLWSIWLLVDFFLLGLRGNGVSNIFHATFCPMIFIFFYTITLYCERIRFYTIVGFLAISILAIYLNFICLSQFQGVIIGEELGITNLVYWCLCPLPILLLMEKNWQRAASIGVVAIVVLITGKRSANIAIALILVFYVIGSLSRGRHKTRNTLIIIILALTLYFSVTMYLENAFSGVIDRMNSISEDEGSGRLPLYEDVFDTMKDNSFVDWLFGRGYGSIQETRHSNAHNDALQMLFEYGVIGLVVYVIMIVDILKRMLVLRKHKSTFFVGYAASIIITITLGLVSNLVVFYSYFSFICAYWGIVEAKMIQSGRLKKIIVKKI